MIQGHRVFVAEFHIDLRYGLSRLLGVALDAGLDPREGDVILFGGRNRRRLKVLHGDATGVWLSNKSFFDSDAACRIATLAEGGMRTISMAEFAWLVDGRKSQKN